MPTSCSESIGVGAWGSYLRRLPCFLPGRSHCRILTWGSKCRGRWGATITRRLFNTVVASGLWRLRHSFLSMGTRGLVRLRGTMCGFLVERTWGHVNIWRLAANWGNLCRRDRIDTLGCLQGGSQVNISLTRKNAQDKTNIPFRSMDWDPFLGTKWRS
jgi:hypothetical protein